MCSWPPCPFPVDGPDQARKASGADERSLSDSRGWNASWPPENWMTRAGSSRLSSQAPSWPCWVLSAWVLTCWKIKAECWRVCRSSQSQECQTNNIKKKVACMQHADAISSSSTMEHTPLIRPVGCWTSLMYWWLSLSLGAWVGAMQGHEILDGSRLGS